MEDALSMQVRIRAEAESQSSELQDMSSWLSAIRARENTRKAAIATSSATKPVASAAAASAGGGGNAALSPAGAPSLPSSAARHTYDVGYKRWDTFDPDAADTTLSTPASVGNPSFATSSASASSSSSTQSPIEPSRGLIVKVHAMGSKATTEGSGGADTAPLTSPTLQAHSKAEEEREAGNAAFRKGDFDAALLCYQASVRLNPEGACLSHSNSSLTYLHKGRPTDALLEATHALSLDASHTKSWLRRAAAHNALGQHEASLCDLRVALSLDPSSKDALLEERKVKQAILVCRQRKEKIDLEEERERKAKEREKREKGKQAKKKKESKMEGKGDEIYDSEDEEEEEGVGNIFFPLQVTMSEATGDSAKVGSSSMSSTGKLSSSEASRPSCKCATLPVSTAAATTAASLQLPLKSHGGPLLFKTISKDAICNKPVRCKSLQSSHFSDTTSSFSSPVPTTRDAAETHASSNLTGRHAHETLSTPSLSSAPLSAVSIFNSTPLSSSKTSNAPTAATAAAAGLLPERPYGTALRVAEKVCTTASDFERSWRELASSCNALRISTTKAAADKTSRAVSVEASQWLLHLLRARLVVITHDAACWKSLYRTAIEPDLLVEALVGIARGLSHAEILTLHPSEFAAQYSQVMFKEALIQMPFIAPPPPSLSNSSSPSFSSASRGAYAYNALLTARALLSTPQVAITKKMLSKQDKEAIREAWGGEEATAGLRSIDEGAAEDMLTEWNAIAASFI